MNCFFDFGGYGGSEDALEEIKKASKIVLDQAQNPDVFRLPACQPLLARVSRRGEAGSSSKSEQIFHVCQPFVRIFDEFVDLRLARSLFSRVLC